MANRVLRDWTTSEKMDELSEGAEVFFTRLIMKADDHGCFHGSARLLKAFLFPLKNYSETQILGWRKECEASKLIQVYTIEGKNYLQIINFGQRLRTMKSSFPLPDSNPRSIVSESLTDDSNQRPETKRNEVETETETESEGENARATFVKDFNWFKKQIDEIWLDQLPIEKKENVPRALIEAWAHLSADKLRLHNAGSRECKQLLNTWLSRMKPENKNGKPFETTTGATRPQHFRDKVYNTKL